MRFQIKHEIEGRLRVHMMQNRMTFAEADTLQYYLEGLPGVAHAKVYEKTCDAVVTYTAERADIITALKQFCYDRVELPTAISGHSSREMNAEYQSRLVGQTLIHFGKKLFLPYPVRAAITAVKSAKYLYHGAHCLFQRTGCGCYRRFRIPRRNEHSSICYVFVRDRRNIGGMDT